MVVSLGQSIPAPPDAGDVTPPTVTAIVPVNNAANVTTGTTIRATFSEGVLSSSLHAGTFSLQTAGGTPVTGTLSRDGVTVVFTPNAPLMFDTEYVLTIAGVQDQRGNVMNQPYSSGFRTISNPSSDLTPPTIVAVNPADGADGIATSTTITLTFSEAIDVTTVTTTSIQLRQNGIPVTGSLFVTGSTQVTLTPAALAPATTCTLQVSGVHDLAGNALSQPFTATFITRPADQAVAGAYRSYAFPVTGTNVSVYGQTATRPTSLVVVNPTSTSQSYVVSGTLSTASIRASSSRRRATGGSVQRNLRQADFQGLLRELERRLPTFRRSSDQRPRPRIYADLVGNETTFSIVQDDGSTVTAPSTCRQIVTLPSPATSGNANFYFDQDIAWDATAQSFVSQLAAAWPSIYATVRQKFGSEPPAGAFNGISLNDDITILIVSSEKIDPTGADLAGFFYSGDLYSSAIDPASNQRKMLYLNYLPDSLSALKGVLAHELQHMVNFYQHKSRGLNEEDWLNEAMSGYAEHLCGFGVPTGNRSKALQTRDYLAAVSANSLTEWTGSHEDYGQVYLFGTWLGQQYGTSGSVISLLAGTETGTDAVAAFTGKPFTDILTEWSIALLINDTTGGSRYGIPGLSLRTTYPYNGGSVTFNGPQPVQRSAPFSETLGVAPHGCAVLEVTGGTGNRLQLTVPTTGLFYELHAE